MPIRAPIRAPGDPGICRDSSWEHYESGTCRPRNSSGHSSEKGHTAFSLPGRNSTLNRNFPATRAD
ncbi:hypothetical protein CBI38_08005 [Rhodococcus oxybenzonivorans]|uniref:Uncharacterized protein n=1 Tax=Rhodococcus oxybenzonivorans TaxID=1990687 RepID=A0A2S2BSE8_9NOCA|nr:hypothetical protein CBI38_08005 [Rhodococcus oxybenzonivorans]